MKGVINMLCCAGLIGGLYVGQYLGGPWTFIAPATGFGVGLLGDIKIMHKKPHHPPKKDEEEEMHIGAKTKVHDILSTYPFIKEYLIRLHPHFKTLNNPLVVKTVGKVATLNKAANTVGIPIDRFLSGIADEIKNRTGETVGLGNNKT
jgi:hypothetical protein